MALLAIDCVMPAAGLSSRMGSHKLLAEFGGRPLIQWAVEHAARACRRVIVVIGHDGPAVRSAAQLGTGASANLTFVNNPDYERGMLTSISYGATEVATQQFFVAPADMPFLVPSLFAEIADIAQDQAATDHPGGRPVAWFPFYNGRPAHPVLIDASLRADLLSAVAEPDTRRARSMRRFLSAYPTATVEVEDDGAVIDIDTLQALRTHESRARESQ